MTTKLSLANLGSLPKSVAVPKYDRASLKPGILHFGVGNFHRSHQAVYLDDLFNSGEGHDWAIVGAGVFDGEKAGRAKLAGAGLADDGRRAGCRAQASARHRRDDRFPDAGRRG